MLHLQKESREEWHKMTIPSGSDVEGPVHTRSFNLTGLNASVDYEALILSRNRFGWSYPSKVIKFTTHPTSCKHSKLYILFKIFTHSNSK